jgi:hypothetical protein
VTDAGANCVHLFSTGGRWLRSTGWKGAAAGQFDEPAAVASLAGGTSFVLEKANHRVQVLDDTLGVVGEFGKADLAAPLDVAAEGNTVCVVNTGLGRIELYRWNGRRASKVRSFGYGGGEGRGIAMRDGRIYLSVVNEVRCYDTTGTLLHALTGRAIDFVLPQGIVPTPKGVSVADFFGGRIFETTADLLDPTPAVLADSSKTVIAWTSVATAAGAVTIGETGEQTTEKLFGTNHRLELPAGTPGSVRHARVTPTIRTVPPRSAPSRSYPLPPLTPRGRHWYSRLPMLALIFANVTDTPRAGAPPQPLLADSEITRIRRQLTDAVRFYWVHSGMRLFLDLETLVIHEPLRRSDLYGAEWWYPPKDSVLASYLRLNGKRLADYSGLLYLTCTQGYDTVSRSWVLAGKGGAFTNGVGTGKGYGISWWDVTRANHNAGNNWLMVHEFNHQLDDIFMVSGYPEYWFNHISPTIGTAGPFGEHFDANRYILRMVPPAEWSDLRTTTLEEASDRDHDGIPDNAPLLPLDELRLGSDSTTSDTDGDGVADADELAFSNWIVEGWGESAGTPLLPNLRSADADGDGLSDSIDPIPCSRLKTEARRSTTTILGSLTDARAQAELAVRWASDTLAFSLAMKEPRAVKIMIDLGNDGWFSGSDNILITSAPEAPATAKLQLFDGSSAAEWPHMNDTLARHVPCTASWTTRDGVTTCRLSVSGLALEGRTLGILAGLLVPFDSAGNKRYVDFFEPNRFFPLTLKP